MKEKVKKSKALLLCLVLIGLYAITIMIFRSILINERIHHRLYLKLLGEIHGDTLSELFGKLPDSVLARDLKLANARNFIRELVNTDTGIVELVMGMDALSDSKILNENENRKLIDTLRQECRAQSEWIDCLSNKN